MIDTFFVKIVALFMEIELRTSFYEFKNFYENRYIIRGKKTICHRKYHIENVLNALNANHGIDSVPPHRTL